MNTNSIYDFYIPKYMHQKLGCSPNSGLHQFYAEFIINKGCREVLELGYGTGLLTTLLLRKKIRVVALDKSQESEKFFRQHYAQESYLHLLEIQTLDFLEYNPCKLYSAVVAPDEFLVHFISIEELDLFFERLANLLDSQGFFLTDMRYKNNKDLSKITHHPIIPVQPMDQIDKVKYVSCTNWNTKNHTENVLYVNYKYDELDCHGNVINSFVKVLKQGIFSIDQLQELSAAHGLVLTNNTEDKLSCNTMLFEKK
jgi:SAM-dependent methyltransferase